MRVGAALRPTFAVLAVLSCVVAPAAGAAPTIDLGLGDVKVPQIDLPTVKPPTIDSSGVKAPSVDVDPTVNSATGAVDDVVGGGGNDGGSTGSGGNPPATGGGTDTPATPVTPTTPGTTTTPSDTGTDATQSNDSTEQNTQGKKAAADKAGAGPGNGGANSGQGQAARAANQRQAAKQDAKGGASKPAKVVETQPSTLTRVVQAFSWTIFGVLLAITVLALGMTGRSATLARLTRKLKHQRGELTDDVGAMQAALLPVVPAKIGPTHLSVAYRSAGPASGGDFHDVVELEGGRLGILVGDACGHGREALHTTALVHYTVRAYLEAGLQPRDAIRLADEKVGGKLGGDFVTVLCGIYDPRDSSLNYATAGHPAPIVVGGPGDQAISLLTDPPVGVGSPSGTRQTRISVPDGCQLCFFSDGLSEARTADGALIGRPGLIEQLEEIGPSAEANELVSRVSESVTTDDDVTMLVLRPEAATGTDRVTEDLELDAHVAQLGELRYFLAAAGLDARQAQRTQVEAIRRTQGKIAHLRVHHGGGHDTNWEFTGAAPSAITPTSPAPHLELVLPERQPAVSSPAF